MNALTNIPSEHSKLVPNSPLPNANLTTFSEPEPINEAATFARYQERVNRRKIVQARIALVTLVAPLLLTLAFIYVVASPMYQAETRFSIRGADAPQGGTGGLIAAGNPGMALTGFVDGYAVRDFLQSRDAMEQLDTRIRLAGILSRQTNDPFAYLPPNPTSDALFDMFRSVVTARYNMVEQIVVVDTQAFSSEEAVRLSRELLVIADEFVNKLNRRSLEDQVNVAQSEVTRAENRSAAARAALAKWRVENSNIDPAGDVRMLNQILTQLEGQLTSAESELSQLRSLSPNNPRRGSAELAVQSIRDQIAETRKRFGGGNTNAAAQIFAYEALSAEGGFAEQSLATARQNLSSAQQVLQRQQRFVSVISQPVAQMRPAYPDKTKLILLSILGGMVLAFSFGSAWVSLGELTPPLPRRRRYLALTHIGVRQPPAFRA